jgi:hypothetical protein
MFDELVVAAAGACGVGAVGAWARAESAACAQRLFAIADALEVCLWPSVRSSVNSGV